MSRKGESQVRQVPKEWIDFNGHMNLAYYVMAFDHALDVFLDEKLAVGPSLAKASEQGPFVLQSHIHYLRELTIGDQFYCEFILLDGDAKRLHIAGTMSRKRDDAHVCVMEQIVINVSHETRRSTPYPREIQARILALIDQQKNIERPAQIGREIGLAPQ